MDPTDYVYTSDFSHMVVLRDGTDSRAWRVWDVVLEQWARRTRPCRARHRAFKLLCSYASSCAQRRLVRGARGGCPRLCSSILIKVVS